MIKFFQKLKAKKGFTLVELIVVIAIIGVLAAILVPTMLGYVTSSRVTSANTTASSLKNNIDTFLTNADTAGYGMKLSSNAQAIVSFNIAGGTWTVTVSAGNTFSEGEGDGEGSLGDVFKGSETMSWSGSGEAAPDAVKSDATCADDLLAIELKNLFPEIENGCFEAYLEGGKALYCWYTADADDVDDVDGNPTVEDFENGVCAWDDNTAGVTSDGFIVGTAPALTLGTVAAEDAGDGE